MCAPRGLLIGEPVRMSLQVTCMDCGYESNTFDPFLDISLEINRASSVKKALEVGI